MCNISLQHTLSVFLCCAMLLAWAGASTPTFVTGMAGIVETGNVALVTTGTYSPYGFTSSSTTITYTNAYSAKPLFGYGYQSIQSLFPVTSSATETIFDLTPTISTSSTVLLLNFTANAVSQFSVNYMVAVSTFFMEIKNFHFLLTSQSVFTQLDGTTRTATLSLGYVMKSNSSNAVVAYTTIGLSMMRTNIHTFEYTLTIASTTSTTLSLTLSVMPLNRMRFIRLCLFDYETIPIKYLPPYYLTMGFGVTLSEAIPESSGLGFTNQGTIMTGMSDWIVSDASGSIDYSLGVTSTNPTYLLTSYSISRITVSYVWYYQQFCPESYFLSKNACVGCDYTCLTCSGQSNTQCLTCATTRTFTSGSCPCSDNYTDTSSALCQYVTCSPTCKTCKATDQCGSCDSTLSRTLNGTNCDCNIEKFDQYALDQSDTNCYPCHITCMTCSISGLLGDAKTCLTCNLVKDRRTYINANKTCVCIDGFFHNNTRICASCQYTCATCTNRTVCVTCNASLQRAYNATSKFCYCLSQYYDNGASQTCQKCLYHCLTCTNGTACATCPSTRTIQDTKLCTCNSGYYDDNTSLQCQGCYYTCQACSNSVTCTQCSSAMFRTMSSGNCNCMSGYYNVPSNQQCAKCDATCATCNAVGTTCLTCDAAKHREKSTRNQCLCISGYYQTSPTVSLCGSCDYTCLTCNTEATTCDGCDATKHRTLPAGGTNCPCDDGYYENGIPLCAKCSSFCLTCNDNAACTSCDAATRDTGDMTTCACLPGYYESGTSSCVGCLPTCATCLTGDTCQTCPANRQKTAQNTCGCITRTYEPACESCIYYCLTCFGTSTNCTSCNAASRRTMIIATATCDCYQGYYSDGANELCLPCDTSCQTCQTGSACLTCPTNRVTNTATNLCSCKSAFFENLAKNCVACMYSCENCSTYSVCTTCSAAHYRTLSSGRCNCMSGYYDTNVTQLCLSCHPSCKTCSDYTICLTCDSALHRYISASACPCIAGYFSSPATGLCVACDISCSQCVSLTACTTCATGRISGLSGLCICPVGKYDDPASRTCSLCLSPCTQCTQTSTKCTNCDSTRTLINNVCSCTGITYDTGTTCVSCLNTCQSCINGTACQACLLSSGRTLDGSHQCLCPSGFTDLSGTVVTCLQCHYSCQTCVTQTNCAGDCKTGSGRVPATGGGLCVCPTYYYFDDYSNAVCIPCAITCLSCSTISTNCTDCDVTINRVKSDNNCICSSKYFDDTINAACQSCDYRCQTCGNTATCSSCNATKYRNYITGPFCACMSGYYDVSNIQTCSACSYKCLTCSGTALTCLTCASTRTIDSGTSTCPCNTGYYDAGVSACSSCSYKCLTCSDVTTCNTCPDTRNKNSFSDCVCKDGYFNVDGTQLCQTCHPSCLTCSKYQVCTLCKTDTFRVLSGNSCICPSTYYDQVTSASTYVCGVCPYSCATCMSLSQCTSCNPLAQRTYDSITKLCKCNDGYYNQDTNTQCILCPFDCKTCSSATICLSCNQQRTLVADRCPCTDSFYLNGSVCVKCPPQCLTCVNSSYCNDCTTGFHLSDTHTCICQLRQYTIGNTGTCGSCQYSCLTCVGLLKCASCDLTKQRIPSGSFCICQDGYYDDGLSHQQCVVCQASCMLCTNGTECLTCDPTKLRVYDGTTKLCSCKGGYYEDSLTHLCTLCNYKCLNCLDENRCSSCPYNRIQNLIDNTCNCPDGTFDNGGSAVCLSCDVRCLTCTSATTCSSCLTSNFRQLPGSKCPCMSGYFQQNGQPICIACSVKCSKCSISRTNCTECLASNSRSGTPDCACAVGTYDDGVNAACKPCDYRCVTCLNGLTCIDCSADDHRTLTVSTSMCDCMSSYFPVANIAACAACKYSCLTCNQIQKCLTCPTTRTSFNSTCICSNKYYDDNVSQKCLACQYTCATCTINTSCKNCTAAYYRVLNTGTLFCDCKTGYYDTGLNDQACGTCNPSCYSCTIGTACATCPGQSNKVVNVTTGSNYCVCRFAYYENITAGLAIGLNSLCLPCSYTCHTCSNPTFCLACSPGSHRSLSTQKQCVCDQYYFDYPNQQTCLNCNAHCSTCFGTMSNQCLTCDSATYYLSSQCFVDCPSHYRQNTTTRLCQPCTPNCLTCTASATICITCAQTYFLFVSSVTSTICIQNCPDYYYQLNKQCFSCISPCVRCSAKYVCIDCIALFYLNGHNCYPCHSSCISCKGSSAYDCTICTDGYYLSNSLCQKLTCTGNQYVSSSAGCTNCSITYAGSLTCTALGVTSCTTGYMLVNNVCQTCNNVVGYYLDTTTNSCRDLCGDGVVITSQCDDGNTLNGDGCSSSCTVQDGWSCPNNVCQLSSGVTATMLSVTKTTSQNQIIVLIQLTPGLRLATNNFILSFQSATKYTYTITAMNTAYTIYSITINYLQTIDNDKLTIKIISPATSRLLTASQALTISLSLSVVVPISTNPAAIYIDPTIRMVYKDVLLYLLAVLHFVLVVVVVIALIMKLNVMLLVIDAMNGVTILYIIGVAAYGITSLSGDAVKGLQPFIYPFGLALSDTTSAFYYFNYTQLMLSGCIVQIVIILICFLLRIFFQQRNNEEYANYWHYLTTSFMFAFAYDILLASVVTFFWTGFTSMQATFSLALSIVFTILVCTNTFMYYTLFTTGSKAQTNVKKVVPTVSFITNDVDKDRSRQHPGNMFMDDDQIKSKQSKKFLDNSEDGRTDTLLFENEQSNEQMYDISPSVQVNYNIRSDNHIGVYHLPIRCLIFAIILVCVVNITSSIPRCAIILGLTLVMLIHLMIWRNEQLTSVRNSKLIIIHVLYVLLALVQLLGSVFTNSTGGEIEAIIIALVVATIIAIIIGFVVNVYYSSAYRQYLIDKKNQEIIEKNKQLSQNKVYTKGDSKDSTIKNIFISDHREEDAAYIDHSEQQPVSQQRGYLEDDKQIRLNSFERQKNGQIRTIFDTKKNNKSNFKDGTTFVNIDQEISDDTNTQHKRFADLFDGKQSLEKGVARRRIVFDKKLDDDKNGLRGDSNLSRKDDLSNFSFNQNELNEIQEIEEFPPVTRQNNREKKTTKKSKSKDKKGKSKDKKAGKKKGKKDDKEKLDKDILQYSLQINLDDLKGENERRQEMLLQMQGKQVQVQAHELDFERKAAMTTQTMKRSRKNLKKATQLKDVQIMQMIQDDMGAESRNELNKNSRLSGYAELDSMPIRTNSTDQEEIKVNSKDLEDIMGELGEMPKGVQKGDIIRYKNRSGTGQRKFSIDEISSIKEQRDQYIEQGIGSDSSEGMTVFKKILQDYKVYRHKKIDKKVLKKDLPK